jgi:predicted MPP superfamily phosphohydrolase
MAVISADFFGKLSLNLLLVAGAAFGHVAVLVAVHNQCYARILSRKLSHFLRFILLAAIAIGPPLFLLCFGWEVLDVFGSPGDSVGRWLLDGWLLACWFVGFGGLPIVLVRGLLRRPPAALLRNDTRTVDVAAVLGYKPIGRGKYWRLALLPRNEIFCVDFSERTLHLPRLPAVWDGLRVLHLSDVHFHGTPAREFFRVVMDQCNVWEPDVVAFTGDLVDTNVHYRWIVPLLGRLKWREAGLAILGNHDSWRDANLIRRRLRKLRMHVLGNDWKLLYLRGEPLVVVGHEGPWFKGVADLSDCPTDPFRLCLSHTPDHIEWARQNGIDLMLSGHVHGGQIRFPAIGSVFVPSRYGRRYDCGTFLRPPTLLHVSRGLSAKDPVRYNCRPEVTLLVLRRDPPAVVAR